MVENVIQTKSRIMINVDVGVKIWKNIMCAKKEYIWNPAACSCGNGKYLGNIIDDWLIMFDDIIDTIITIVLVISVIIFCYLIKNQAREKL